MKPIASVMDFDRRMREWQESLARLVDVTLACGHAGEKVLPEQVAFWQTQRCDACTEADRRKARNEARQEGLALRQAGAGIPVQYHGRTLRDLEGWPPELIFHCNHWVQEGGGLYIWSQETGTGKTSAAAAAAWMLLERMGVEFVTASQLQYWVRAAYGSPELDAVSRLAGRAGALVLDDFGEESTSEDVAGAVKNIVQRRIDAGSHLIITSNYSPGAACERDDRARVTLGRRLASRIQGYCTVIEVQGRDHRLDR